MAELIAYFVWPAAAFGVLLWLGYRTLRAEVAPVRPGDDLARRLATVEAKLESLEATQRHAAE